MIKNSYTRSSPSLLYDANFSLSHESYVQTYLEMRAHSIVHTQKNRIEKTKNTFKA